MWLFGKPESVGDQVPENLRTNSNQTYDGWGITEIQAMWIVSMV